ncbi:MAG: beta-N-acetylhexosaminidase [Proteobacteria bacterium]|nr:beta-N-acetylhexosaminidase [Pseudomonadota bacterium]
MPVGDSTSLAERKRRAGQRLVIGFQGQTVTPELRELVRELRPSGFCLFKRNVDNPDQVAELNRALFELVPGALITVDQEGGRVQRLRTPSTEWPPMRTVGSAGRFTEMAARAISREVRATGFNVNFAPVADVDSNPDNPVIGDRSFSRDPHEVAAHLTRFIAAAEAEGVLTCAKHFPGHGDTNVDSHLDLPRVATTQDGLRQTELVPFRAAIAADVGSVMVSHVVYEAFDRDWPATMSEIVVPKLLRDELGFDGLVFSDDMEMKAVMGRYSTREQVNRATRATLDVFLVCHTPDLQFEFFQEMVRGQEDNPGFERHSADSERRVQAVRNRLAMAAPAPGLEVVGCSEYKDLANQIREAGA